MTYVYWHQGQLPPTGQAFDKEWVSIVKQLHSKHPIPAEALPSVDLDRKAMDAIMQDAPRAENIDRATMTEARGTGIFEPGDRWSEDFDYTGMLRWGAEAPDITFDNLGEMEEAYESFQDVNYHREGGDLGNAIEWATDDGPDEPRVLDFMKSFRAACAKALGEIDRN